MMVTKLKQQTKRNKPKPLSKIATLSMALLMCMSLFIFPTTAHASENTNPTTHVAPPTVHAEIIGSLLRIRTSAGFYAIEAVYINGRRFNHRVDAALVVDVNQYAAEDGIITVHAVDFAGNHSNTVLLTLPEPTPILPPVPNNITPDGQGEVLDHLTDGDGIEFITIETPSGNVFHLIIDHTRSSNNVFFLNSVTEWDLLTLAAEADLPIPPNLTGLQPPPPEMTVIEREPQEPESEPIPPPEPESGGRAGLYIFLLIAGVGAFGAVYYLKILKPKKEREMYADDGEYEEDDGFEDVDDSESDESYNADSDTDGDNEGR